MAQIFQCMKTFFIPQLLLYNVLLVINSTLVPNELDIQLSTCRDTVNETKRSPDCPDAHWGRWSFIVPGDDMGSHSDDHSVSMVGLCSKHTTISNRITRFQCYHSRDDHILLTQWCIVAGWLVNSFPPDYRKGNWKVGITYSYCSSVLREKTVQNTVVNVIEIYLELRGWISIHHYQNPLHHQRVMLFILVFHYDN